MMRPLNRVSRLGRFFGMVALTSVFSAGCGGSKSSEHPSPTGDKATRGTSHAKLTLSPLDESLDVSFIPPSCCGAMILRPRKIANTQVAKHAKLPAQLEAFSRKLGFDPFSVEQAIVLVDPFPGGNVSFFPAAIIRFADAVDAKAIASGLWPDVQTKSSGNAQYLVSKMAGLAGTKTAVYIVDRRTVLVAPEPTLLKMIDVRDTDSPLTRRMRRVDPSSDVALVFAVAPVREGLSEIISQSPADQLPEPLDLLLRSTRQLDGILMELSLSGDSLITVQSEPMSEKATDEVEQIALQVQASLHSYFAAVAPRCEGVAPPEVAPQLEQLFQQLASSVSVKRSESLVVMRMKRPALLTSLSSKFPAFMKWLFPDGIKL